MKKITNKLSLGKQTLTQLDANQMASVKGGLYLQDPEDGGEYFLSIGRRCQSNNDTGTCTTLGTGGCTGIGRCHQ